MNKSFEKPCGVALAAFALLGVTVADGQAFAADYPARIEIGQRSARLGMAAAEVQLLQRKPGSGMNVVADALLARFAESTDPVSTRGALKTERDLEQMTVFGSGWNLTVYGDGTRIKYRNHAYLDAASVKGVPVAQRMSQDVMEKLGRQFVAAKLGPYAALGKNETLIPYFTEFQIQGGGSTLAGVKPPADEVVAGTVVFTRTVGGMPVLGPGSKIAVMFATDGQPVGFDIDWSAYEPAGKTQKAVALAEIQGRAEKLSPIGLGGPDTKTTRFECGYFDLGARKRDAKAPIQAACLVHANKQQIVDKDAYARDPRSGHTVAAHMAVIPAGATIEHDASWPQALALLGEKPTSNDIPGQTRR